MRHKSVFHLWLRNAVLLIWPGGLQFQTQPHPCWSLQILFKATGTHRHHRVRTLLLSALRERNWKCSLHHHDHANRKDMRIMPHINIPQSLLWNLRREQQLMRNYQGEMVLPAPHYCMFAKVMSSGSRAHLGLNKLTRGDDHSNRARHASFGNCMITWTDPPACCRRTSNPVSCLQQHTRTRKMPAYAFYTPNVSSQPRATRHSNVVWDRYRASLIREYRSGGLAQACRWLKNQALPDFNPTSVLFSTRCLHDGPKRYRLNCLQR